MEEATELANYLPLSFKTPKEQEDIEIWLNLDRETLAVGPQFQAMRELHDAFLARSGSEDKSDAA